MARGRPKVLDESKALDAIILLLWREGINGISLNDIAGRIGVSKPSLTKAFGSKDEVIAAALRQYYRTYGKPAEETLLPDIAPEEAVARYLAYFVVAHTGETTPRGCLLATAASDCATVRAGPVREAIDGAGGDAFDTLRHYLAAAGVAHPEELARFVGGQLLAMSIMARNGAGREELARFANRATKAAWTR